MKMVANLCGAELVLVAVVALISTASAIELNPQAPPGLGEKIEMFLGWVYWLAIIAAVGALIFSIVSMALLDRDARTLLILSLIALAFLVALPQILQAIGI